MATKVFIGKSVVINNEKYFTFSNSSLARNDGYYTDNKLNAPEDVRFKKTQIFEPKVLVWLAISEHGVSKVYIHKSKCAINSEIYLNKCLKQILVPFVRDRYPDNDYVFWPDLASAHYANNVTNYLEAQSIKFVAKSDNPPNVPQARPIENFWASLSLLVYIEGWRAKTKKQLIAIIKKKLKKN